MNVKLLSLSTTPSRRNDYWQFILIPTVSVYKRIDDEEGHTAINFEWLFWAATILIYNDDKRTVYHLEDI